MKITGGCHCGALTYEAEIDPATVGMCHCTDCQRLSGSPYRVVVRTPADKFVLRGTPTIYVKIADSGARRAQAFCGACGAPIYAAAPTDPPNYSLRWGSIDQRASLAPRRQIWCASSVGWAPLEGVPRVERQG